jgi:hypothetical protein
MMDERPSVGTKAAQSGQEGIEDGIGREELPIQKGHPFSAVLLLVLLEPFHAAAMRRIG